MLQQSSPILLFLFLPGSIRMLSIILFTFAFISQSKSISFVLTRKLVVIQDVLRCGRLTYITRVKRDYGVMIDMTCSAVVILMMQSLLSLLENVC